jgi:hypothetical protein
MYRRQAVAIVFSMHALREYACVDAFPLVQPDVLV